MISLRSLALAGLLACSAAATVPAPVLAQTIVVARPADSQSLDPGEAASIEDQKIGDWVFDGLVKFEGETPNIIPALATSWETSEDGLTWTFKLREGVTFHDGTPFDADAVVFSFKRQFDKESPYYSPRFTRWPSKFSDMTDVVAVDPMTVEIKLKAPAPAMLPNLAIYMSYIVSPTAVEADPEGFRENPVGTGPFKFVRWQKDNFIELERNADYWDGPAEPEQVIVRVVPDSEVRMLTLRKGESQIIDNVPFQKWAEVDADPSMEMHKAQALGFSGMAMRSTSEALSDIRVRRAIASAINRERLYATVFASTGGIADQPVPEGWMGHSDEVTPIAYDPEAAKALVAEAGLAEGTTLRLVTFNAPRPYFPSPADGAALIKSDLAAIGIDVDIRMMTFGAYLDAVKKDEYDLALVGWTASTLDPDGILYPLYHSRFGQTGQSGNRSRLNSDELDALLIAGRATYDPEERAEIYAKASKIIADFVPTVYLNHPVTAVASSSKVKGLYRHSSNQVPLTNVTIEE